VNPPEKHVLIVDDEPEIRELLACALARRGWRVSQAENGRDACQRMREDPADLIVSDLQLEEGDGLQAIRDLKTMRADVPVLLLTGALHEPDVIESIKATHGVTYASKTDPLQQILREIARLLDTPPAGE
jgi:two-component system, OmpR family, response regulator